MNDTTVIFSQLNPVRSGSRSSMSRGAWTLVGGVAIALWATWPLLSLQIRSVPPFEGMALIFVLAGLVTTRLVRAADARRDGLIVVAGLLSRAQQR
jgi:hypothetical protein